MHNHYHRAGDLSSPHTVIPFRTRTPDQPVGMLLTSKLVDWWTQARQRTFLAQHGQSSQPVDVEDYWTELVLGTRIANEITSATESPSPVYFAPERSPPGGMPATHSPCLVIPPWTASAPGSMAKPSYDSTQARSASLRRRSRTSPHWRRRWPGEQRRPRPGPRSNRHRRDGRQATTRSPHPGPAH